METLLQNYEQTCIKLLEAEKQKLQMELDNIPLDSKETLTKLYNKLLSENENYYNTYQLVKQLQSTKDILEKQINFIRDIAHVFKAPEELQKFISRVKA